MELEKNLVTRNLYVRLLLIEDKIQGKPFPQMKRVKQTTLYNCGPAVLQALFSLFGKKISQVSVVKALKAQNKIKDFGLDMESMSKAVDILGKKDFVLWKKTNATVNNLDQIINIHKYPVGVEWQGIFHEYEDEDNGHYSIITKLDQKSGYLRLADPFSTFSQVDRKFKINFFEKRWWDTNQVGKKVVTDKRMMFVITKKDETWPKKLGMKK